MLIHPRLPGLRVLMAMSFDGFVARGPDDDMKWTGTEDKQLFRSLTQVGGVLGMGRVTYDLCGERLRTHGRRPVCLSASPGHGEGLGSFAFSHPGAWLIGGQTIVREAMRIDLVDEVHLIENQTELGQGIKLDLPLTADLWELDGKLVIGLGRARVDSLVHRVYRRKGRKP